MKRVGIPAIAILLIASVVSVDRLSAVGGQKRWGSEPMPRAGLCFFQDTTFNGQYFCVGAGEDLAQLPPGMNDKISSLRIVGNVEVMVFKDVRFRGPSARFSTDVGDLRREGWNDQISSLRVTNVSVAWDRGRSPSWGREAMPREGACFYRDTEFRGNYFCVPRGASYAMVPPGFNDQISSIRVLRAGGVLIFEDRDFGGRNVRVTSDVSDLRRGAWNDKISSIRVF
jgi:Beta/Gamma crystallin